MAYQQDACPGEDPLTELTPCELSLHTSTPSTACKVVSHLDPGLESALPTVMGIPQATEGTRWLSTIKSMYQPTGVKARVLGTVTVSEVLVLELIGRSTNRCSVSHEWVVAMGRIRCTH